MPHHGDRRLKRGTDRSAKLAVANCASVDVRFEPNPEVRGRSRQVRFTLKNGSVRRSLGRSEKCPTADIVVFPNCGITILRWQS